jgi:cAMP phosphodiesterase
MKLRVLGNMGTSCKNTYSSSLLIDEHFLIDAGTGAFRLSLENIDHIGDVMITHSHLDHLAALCFLADCRIGGTNGHGLTVHCLSETAQAIREHMLNNTIWPDFENIKIDGTPLMSFNIINSLEPFTIHDNLITPLAVEHTAPTTGYCLHGARENFVVFFDFWDASEAVFTYLRQLENFNRMTIEVSYDEGNEALAKSAGHLTPILLEKRLEKLPPDIKLFYCHLKPRSEALIHEQMQRRFGNKVAFLSNDMVFDI